MAAFKRGQRVVFKGYTDGMPSDLVGCKFKVKSANSGEGHLYVKVQLLTPPPGWTEEEFYFLPDELERLTP